MASLRRRVFSATGVLIALQILGTGLGFASWGTVERAGRVQQELAGDQAAVLELARATREAYVHQAHTLIVGGPGHLEHLAEVNGNVDAKLHAVRSLGLPPGAEVAPVHAAIAASNVWFANEIAPLAVSGRLEPAMAATLNEGMERRAEEVEARIGDVLRVLDAAQAVEREAVSVATARAWITVALLTLGGAAIGLVVANRLAARIVGPVAGLRAVTTAFAEGRVERGALEQGDDEISELARAFNRMMAKVVEAEHRRVQVERLAALGEMSGAVAHELLNPLTVMLGDPEMRRPELARCRAEADHARRVVQGLLGFARPGEEPAERIDLATATAAALDRITPTADHADVTVRLAAGPAGFTTASPSAVRQVLDNLLRNAVEASAAGGVVEVEVRPGIIEIRDRGPGVPAAIRARLYEPFVTGRAEGTGLGLAVCQRIVRASGGTLTHVDRDGGGTIARWTLEGGTLEGGTPA